ncbi:MAG: hypothetical protein HC941_29910 [Microcoleus sp. SU_5_3]|nr:hypothetical protein [Microcoleus sp. SU_5_3]
MFAFPRTIGYNFSLGSIDWFVVWTKVRSILRASVFTTDILHLQSKLREKPGF